MNNYKKIILSKLNKKSFVDLASIVNRVMGMLVGFIEGRKNGSDEELMKPTMEASYRAITSLEDAVDFGEKVDNEKAISALKQAFEIKDTRSGKTFGETYLRRYKILTDEISSKQNNKPREETLSI